MGTIGVLVEHEHELNTLRENKFKVSRILTFVNHVLQIFHVLQLILIWKAVGFVARKRQTFCA